MKDTPTKREIDRVLEYLYENNVCLMFRLWEEDNTLVTLDDIQDAVDGEYTIHDWLDWQQTLKQESRQVVLDAFKAGWKE